MRICGFVLFSYVVLMAYTQTGRVSYNFELMEAHSNEGILEFDDGVQLFIYDAIHEKQDTKKVNMEILSFSLAEYDNIGSLVYINHPKEMFSRKAIYLRGESLHNRRFCTQA